MIDLTPLTTTVLLASTGVLLVLLIILLLLRARIFTNYLAHMTDIRLSPRDVSRVFRLRGKAGVREMFLELIIREDLKSGPAITPDTPPRRPEVLP